jgi:hypothetical protein
VVADFQQLQPVTSGGLCHRHCKGMGDQVTLKTVYRTSDEEHLLFLNRIRVQQPDRDCLDAYFADRHWPSSGPEQQMSLQECVAKGMQMAEEKNDVFQWLTSTNKGAEEVCEAALLNKGITRADTEKGYLCDPTSKSTLGILAIIGIILRLTRNLDKARGFVNGALCIVVEQLKGNAYFIAKLLGSGNYVLVHPMEEGGGRFLPCCYGYATTIRRAQGASLSMGCIYFDQKYFCAGRGYGYVAASRFRTRGGCFLYGHKRRTDFLPVGGEGADEVLERGYDSLSDDDDEGRGLEYADDETNVFAGLVDPSFSVVGIDADYQ